MPMTCAFEGCERSTFAQHDVCHAHHQQRRRGLELRVLRPRRKNGEPPALCGFPGCDRGAQSKGLCPAHFQQRRAGIALKPLYFIRPVIPNPMDPSTLLVPLTKGKVAVIDIADAGVVGSRNWHADVEGRTTYAKSCCGNHLSIFLHRLLWQHWGMPDTPEIDHKDTDGLNCRRSNLRPATRSQNVINTRLRSDNTSGVKGVYWDARLHKWRAHVCRDGRNRCVGSFDIKEDAAAAYATVAREIHGEFVRIA